VGALHILKGSRAVVTGGLDFWFQAAKSEQIQCVRVQEPRLQARLRVSHFRLPPGPETDLPQTPYLPVPLFRFPTWFICPLCHRMDRRSLGMDGDASCAKPECNHDIMRQVSFAAVCDHGHLQDFPWREWVHRDRNPSCNKEMTYHAAGSGSLADIRVQCACGKNRNLLGIMSGDLPDRSEPADSKRKEGWSFLTSSLLAPEGSGSSEERRDKTEPFYCQGGRPWLGEPSGIPCTRPLRAILINATNVHYAQVQSALWIPAGGPGGSLDDLQSKLDDPEIRGRLDLIRSLGFTDEQMADNLLTHFQAQLSNVDRAKLLVEIRGGPEFEEKLITEGLSEEEVLRYPEYRKLQEAQTPRTTREYLEIRLADVSKLPGHLLTYIQSISLVDRLRETRVMNGFTRLVPNPPPDAPHPSAHLWKNPPATNVEKWLPAALVFGEGIFICFAEEPLQTWEKKREVHDHLLSLQERENAAAQRMGRPPRSINPRFILLHTLAHLLMRQLSFECGYSSTSLRERLYVSTKPEVRMGGILIYTASGDCEGSMGGLVRMGEAGNFARVMDAALEGARWCSSDPVCTESGVLGGQGIESLNIAACHCCALLPETSCEHFNSYLDRAMVVDNPTAGNVGFFHS